jgi:hypothetical protein
LRATVPTSSLTKTLKNLQRLLRTFYKGMAIRHNKTADSRQQLHSLTSDCSNEIRNSALISPRSFDLTQTKPPTILSKSGLDLDGESVSNEF